MLTLGRIASDATRAPMTQAHVCRIHDAEVNYICVAGGRKKTVPSSGISLSAVPWAVKIGGVCASLLLYDKAVFMAEVIHRYIGRDGNVPAREKSKSEQEREQLDAQWRRKRIAAESAKQRLHEAKLMTMRGELISKQHVTRQASFLVLSLRARLLALAGTLAPKIARACGGGDQRAIESLIDAEVRDVLSEISEMPLRVTDEHWMQKLEENEEREAAKRPHRAAK
jgi:hypothetical protein